MASSITVKGLAFALSGSGRVLVTGSGIQSSGLDAGYGDELTLSSIQRLASSPNVTPEAAAILNSFTESDVNKIVLAFVAPPEPTPVPVFKESEINKPIRVENAPAPVEKTPTPPTSSSSSKPDDDNSKNNQKSEKKATVEATPGTGAGLPNRRTYNPLGDFSSSTYQISLYMVTPEAMNRFVMSGATQVGNSVDAEGKMSDGFYLLAQSGGINNVEGEKEGGNKRAPGFNLDFFIDDLKMTTITSMKETGSSNPASIDIEFNVYEPYGLSFTSKLTALAKSLQKKSTLPGFTGSSNALAQFYVLGLRFYGYDKDGTLVTSANYANSDANGTTDTQALFERFMPIKISKFQFKLTGKTPVYNVGAVNMPVTEALGNKRAQVNVTAPLTGSTVGEMLGSLISKMNKSEEESMKKRKEQVKNKKDAVVLATDYEIEYEPNSTIQDSAMVDPKDFAKYKLNIAMGDVKSTKDSNPAAESKTATNKGKKTVTLAPGTHVIAAIEQVIKQSSYIKSMLKEIPSALSEEPSAENSSPKQVQWFSVSPGIKIKGFDTTLNDYAYTITYYIQTYSIPFVRSPLISKGSTYTGPHKKYEYWYTGKNTEVISYEQQYDNLYYLTGTGSSPPDSTPPVPYADKPQPANQTGSQNKSAEAVNALAVDLYDPGSQAESKMTILGDPDYLVQSVGASMNTVFDKLYGHDRFSISPNGGQVFVELDFKVAEDYDIESGVMSINENIRFYDYDKSVQGKISGITFQLITVQSTLSKGKFTQELMLLPTNLKQFAIGGGSGSDSADAGRDGSKSNVKRTASGGTAITMDPVAAAKARKEAAASDPRRLDLAQNKDKDTNPYSLNNATSKTRNTLQGVDDDRTSSGNSRGYNKASEVYKRDESMRDSVTLLPKRQ